MSRTSLLLLASLLLGNWISCAPLPNPTRNFVATVSQAQSWNLAASMFTMYSLQGVGYRVDFPLYQTNYFYDIENQVVRDRSSRQLLLYFGAYF
jgi:hypothetical protein